MSAVHNITQLWSNGGTILSKIITVTGPAEINVDSYVAPAVTNEQVGVAWTAAQLLSIYMVASSAVKVTTNSTGSPQDTIYLQPNIPLVWTNQSSIAQPFAGAITQFFLTTGSSVSTCLWQIRTVTQASSF